MTTEQRPTLPSYRPIAPSITLPAILPRPDLASSDKRKWDRAFDDSENSSMGSKRRSSDNSDGASTTTNSIVDQRLRRKEQNRAAQRAFRERKERYVKELEDKIRAIEAAHATQLATLEDKIKSMETIHASEIARLAAENVQLRSALRERNEARNADSSSIANERHTDYQDNLAEHRGSTVSYATAATTIESPAAVATVAIEAEQQQQSDKIPTKESKPTTSHSLHSSPSTAHTTATTESKTSPHTVAATSAIACIRDKDGVSFCQKLKEEVCSDAYNQLLTEPLFDEQGVLNETVSNHPVPIVTEPDSTNAGDDSSRDERSKSEQFYEFEQFLQENLSPRKSSMSPGSVHLISCSEVWARIAQDPMFDQYDTYYLYNEIRKIAKCSRTGPMFEESEVREVVRMVKEETLKQQKIRQQEQQN